MMTKTRLLILLLTGTFLSFPAMAQKVDSIDELKVYAEDTTTSSVDVGTDITWNKTIDILNINKDFEIFSSNYAAFNAGTEFGAQSPIGIKGHKLCLRNLTLNGFRSTALYSDETSSLEIKNVKFINNEVLGSAGAIQAWGNVIIRDSHFENNSSPVAFAGAISFGNPNAKQTIENSTFIENSSGYGGGIVAISGTMEIKGGKFEKNIASWWGGGILVDDDAVVKEISNVSFINNHAGIAGGAIYSTKELNISADAGESLFSGNSINVDDVQTSNAIYMESADLRLSAINKGIITFNDGIAGSDYNIHIMGDGSGVVKFNNLVQDVNNLVLSDNSVTHLGLNANVQAKNISVANVTKNAASSPIITVDIQVDKAANKVNSGSIHISEDMSGDYRVFVNAHNPDVLDKKEDNIVQFLFAPNDDLSTSSSFSVARVIGSPYLWNGAINAKGEDVGSTWYLNMAGTTNPDYTGGDAPANEDNDKDKPVVPEVAAGAGLHEAAIEQTRSVVRNISNKVSTGRKYCSGCGIYSTEWNDKQLRNVWVLTQGDSATIDKPIEMDADIWGLEAGFDLQNDAHNTLGFFVSYRKGEYDLSGKSKNLRLNGGSEFDIDSYLAGLYYRYDKNMNWLFATVYGGIQEADARTDDGIAQFDTEGVEIGSGIELGHTFALSDDLTLDPSFGLYYTQLNFDDAKDNVGKRYNWGDIKHLEAEIGVKLEKKQDMASVYVKPSVIQTFTNDDTVRMTGLNQLDTYDDDTLGRIELGGRYGFTDQLSSYSWANYTFGDDYEALSFGLGLKYSW